jgi:hypothetical protein
MQWLLITVLALDLTSIKTEPNLEKRSELALDYANTSLDQAKEAYASGDAAKMGTSLEEVGASVDLAYDSLSETGKDPRGSRFFKRAELRTRELLRRLEGERDTVNFDDRSVVEKIHDHVAEVHDNLLKGIMSKKKKKQ